MSDQQVVISAKQIDGWNYSIPPQTDSKIILLTIGGVAVIGQWSGYLGQYYTAWTPLLKTNKLIDHFISQATHGELKDVLSIKQVSDTEVEVEYMQRGMVESIVIEVNMP